MSQYITSVSLSQENMRFELELTVCIGESSFADPDEIDSVAMVN